MGSELLLYMNMFSEDFLQYWHFVAVVFEITGIVTKFLRVEEV